MATLRLVFRVSKIQQYSENFVQDLLSAGLSSSMHGKPLEVPEFGQIDAVILLGSKAVTRRLCVTRVFTFIRSDGDRNLSFLLLCRSQWEVVLCYWRQYDR